MISTNTNLATNWGSGGGSTTSPALTANTLTVADQTARLALVFGNDPDAGEVGLRDQVWQESDSTLWVLLASDPSQAGSWGQINDRLAIPSVTTNNVPKWNGTTFVDSNVSAVVGGLQFHSSYGPGNVDWIGNWSNYLAINATNGLTLGIGLTALQWLTNTGTVFTTSAVSAATITPAATLHARSTTEQLRLEYSSGVDARFTVDASGNLTIDPTGNCVLAGANRAAYDASPSATTIRDILISHGLMAAS